MGNSGCVMVILCQNNIRELQLFSKAIQTDPHWVQLNFIELYIANDGNHVEKVIQWNYNWIKICCFKIKSFMPCIQILWPPCILPTTILVSCFLLFLSFLCLSFWQCFFFLRVPYSTVHFAFYIKYTCI